jgi:hypothetical protein
MGADIEFNCGECFRDSYNDTNLAWVIGESYWGCSRKSADQNKMMAKLANITDEQIKKYVDIKTRKSFGDNNWEFTAKKQKEYENMFKGKRDFLKKLLDANKLKVGKDGWSV